MPRVFRETLPKYIMTANMKMITSREPVSPWSRITAPGTITRRKILVKERRSPMGASCFARFLAMTRIRASFANSDGWMV